MRAGRRVIPIVLGASAILLFALVVSLNTLISRNQERLREQIQTALGRSFTFHQLRLSLWGGLGLSANNLSIAEDPRFAATPFIQTKELRMLIRWFPLLLGRVEIGRFVLDEPEIQIIRNEEGTLNISALAAAATAAQETAREVKESKRRAPLVFPIAAIQISNGTIDYIDRSSKEPTEIRIRNVAFDLQGRDPSRAAQVKLTANLFDSQGKKISIEGQAGPFGNKKDWTHYPVDLKFQADSLPLAHMARAIPFLREKLASTFGVSGLLTLEAKLHGTFAQPRIRDLNLRGAFFGSTEDNLIVKGELDLSRGSNWEGAELSAEVVADPVSLNQLQKIPFFRQSLPPALSSEGPLSITSKLQGSLGKLAVHTVIKGAESEVRYRDWLKKAKGIAAQLEVKLTRQRGRIVFDESTLILHNLRVKFSGLLEEFPERQLTLKLRAEGMNLSGWEWLLPPLSSYSLGGNLQWDLSLKKNLGSQNGGLDIRGTLTLDGIGAKDKQTGRSIDRLKGHISFTGKEVRVENSSLRLGASDVNFEGTVPDMGQPLLRYTARAPKLSLADLTGSASHRTDQLKDLLTTGEIQIEKGKPALHGSFYSSEGKLQEFPYRNLRGEITWSPSSLSVKQLSFQALNGTLRGHGTWETGAENLQHVALDTHIDAMDLKTLLTQKSPKFKDHIEGRISLKAKLQGENRNGPPPPQNLEGGGEAQIWAGAFKDFNLLELVFLRLSGVPIFSNLVLSRIPPRFTSLFKRRDTPFDTLTATFAFKEGRIHSEDFLLLTPDYSIHGKGWIGLDKTVKWNATLVMSPRFTQELMQEHKNVRYLVDKQGRFAIPFRLEGTLPQVQAKPDLQALSDTVRRGAEQAPGRERGQRRKERRERPQKGLEQIPVK